MPRNTDGTWRNAKSAIAVSPAVLRARSIESEVIHLKQIGLSFDAIADEITLGGRAQAKPLVVIPPDVTFPPDYQISRQACHKAFKRAIAREPSLELEELRRLDNARCEEMLMNLQPAIRKGNPRAIEVGIKVLDHSVKINGYDAAQKHELTGKDGKPLTIVNLLEGLGPTSDKEQ
jgi:hypothetical protein